MRLLTLAASLLISIAAVSAAENSDKLSVRPIGRVLMDGALYMSDTDQFSDGVAIPDIRVGVKASYGKWSCKIDAGFAFGKLSMKDVFLQYDFNSGSWLQAGYFVPMFGLESATSSSMKPGMEEATTDTYLNATGRNIGVMWVRSADRYFVGLTGFVAGTSLTTRANDQGRASVGGAARLLGRRTDAGYIAQAGISASYQSAMHRRIEEDGQPATSPGYFDFSASFPSRVSNVPMLGAEIDHAKGALRLSPELLLAKGRFAIQGQYYLLSVNRKHGFGDRYSAWGAYGQLRGLILGSAYAYSAADAGLATPAPKSLEFVAGFNHTDACSAGIAGGRSNDASLTLNYYINRYMLARMRYSYTDVRNSDVQRDCHVNTIQARLQIIF